jgi:hypothetical protein
LPQQFETLKCCYYWWEAYMNYPLRWLHMTWKHIPNCVTIPAGIQAILTVLPPQFDRLQCWYYWSERVNTYAVEIGSGDMLFILSFIKIGSGIQEIWRVFPQQFERLQCWHYWLEEFLMYATEMTSDGMIKIPSVVTIISGIKVILKLLNFISCILLCFNTFTILRISVTTQQFFRRLHYLHFMRHVSAVQPSSGKLS